MSLAVWTILVFAAGWAFGRWLYPSAAAVARKQGELQRERDNPEMDYRRAHEIAARQSELSRLKGWTGTGG